MIKCNKISFEDEARLNRYINSLVTNPCLLECERLFEYLRILLSTYGEPVRKMVNKLNIEVLRPAITFLWGDKTKDIGYRNRAYELSKKSLLFSARDDFDSFMLYTEIGRHPDEKFWQPRRSSKMAEICQGLQELADDVIDVLFVACPPRVGKSTLGLWFDAWLGGKYPKESILSVGHSASLVNTFYEEVGNFVEGDKYKFLEVFPELRDKISYSAKYQTINFGEEKRYKTLSFRSADGSLAGSVEASLLLHIDDLISGMEEALNPDRLEKKWQQLYGDIRQRRKEGSKILYIGTIWSVLDPQVRFRELLEADENYRIKIIELPALDENDESNFDYKGGFSTAHYRSERAGMDEITWNCIYQQEPMEREGLLFQESLFPTFSMNDMQGTPDMKHSVCDVAWGGNDYLAEPFIYEYNGECYLMDAIHNKLKKDKSQPIVATRIKHHKMPAVIFEANNGGDEYADSIKKKLAEMNYVCKITAKRSPNTANAKLQRIIQYSPEIQNLHILNKRERSPEYQSFISTVLKFNQNGKNKNDDAPDSLALTFMYRANKPKPVTVLPKEYKIL